MIMLVSKKNDTYPTYPIHKILIKLDNRFNQLMNTPII